MTINLFKSKIYTFTVVSVLSIILVISAATAVMPEKAEGKTKSHGKGSMSYDDKVAKEQKINSKKKTYENAKSNYKTKYLDKPMIAQKEKGMKVNKENPRIEKHVSALSSPNGSKDKANGFSQTYYFSNGQGMSLLRTAVKATDVPVPANGHHLVAYLSVEGKTYYLGELKLFSTTGKDTTHGFLLASIRGIDIDLSGAQLTIVETKKLGETSIPEDAVVILSSKQNV